MNITPFTFDTMTKTLKEYADTIVSVALKNPNMPEHEIEELKESQSLISATIKELKKVYDKSLDFFTQDTYNVLLEVANWKMNLLKQALQLESHEANIVEIRSQYNTLLACLIEIKKMKTVSTEAKAESNQLKFSELLETNKKLLYTMVMNSPNSVQNLFENEFQSRPSVSDLIEILGFENGVMDKNNSQKNVFEVLLENDKKGLISCLREKPEFALMAFEVEFGYKTNLKELMNTFGVTLHQIAG